MVRKFDSCYSIILEKNYQWVGSGSIPPARIPHEIVERKDACKRLYQFILEDNKYDVQKYATKWCEMLEIDTDLNEYLYNFIALRKVTDNVKLRDFQYRLLLGKIFTNDVLFKWNVVQDKKCEWCMETQTTKHLLWECIIVQDIWNYIKHTLFINDGYTLTVANIFSNRVHNSTKHIYNVIVLIVKQYLFQQKCLNNKPCSKNLQVIIKNHFRIEREIATNRKTVERKWSPVKFILENL